MVFTNPFFTVCLSFFASHMDLHHAITIYHLNGWAFDYKLYEKVVIGIMEEPDRGVLLNKKKALQSNNISLALPYF